jgi:hypothetical protein
MGLSWRLRGAGIKKPIPGDFHAETIEWIGVLKAVKAAGQRFAVLELGAGFGTWGIAKVHWPVVGTHSRKIDGDLMDLMHRAGWQLENEKPAKLVWNTGFPTLEGMTVLDGTQVWRNPRFSNAPNRQA